MESAARAARLVTRPWTGRHGAVPPASGAPWEEQFRILFDRSADLILVVDPHDHRILRINRAGEALLARPGESLVGRSVFVFCSAGGVEELRDLLARTEAQGASSGLTTLARPDGTGLPVGAAATAFPWGRSLAILLTFRDVSERTKAEEERARFEATLSSVAAEWKQTFDAIPMGIVIVDGRGRVRRLNEAARALTALTFAEIAGMALPEMGTGEPWDTAAVAARTVSAEGAAFFRQVSDPSSGRVWNVGASAMARPKGEESWVIVTIQEATEIVTLQEALRHSERMAEIGELVTGVAHEVRNPLFMISASIDTLEAELDAAVVPRATMELMRDGIRRLVALMQDLLDYGRPSTRERTAGSLESVAYEAIRECEALARASGVEVVSRCAGGVPSMKMDHGRLVRAIQNVVQNAIQHSPAQGVVEVTVEQVTVPGRSWAVCAVRDAGPGFADGDVRHVFEPLFSQRPGGTGLGLSIAQRVVEEHGGQIRAENHPSGGGYVTIRFPCLDPGAEGR